VAKRGREQGEINIMETNQSKDFINRQANAMSAWENQKAILREKFKRLTDADLNFGESRKNEMLGKLALRLGMTTREIRRIIDPNP